MKNVVDNMTQFATTFVDTGIVSAAGMEWLIEHGFFRAPASTKYHGNYIGGLYDHSRAVMESLVDLTEDLGLKWKRHQSPFIVGMFHDLCKIDNYKQVENGFEYADPILTGHGEKSVMLLSQLIELTEEEIMCIRFHMGAYVAEDIKNLGRAIEKYPNVLYTHTADMIAARIKGV